ncbi:MAG: hypothetical protein C5B53_01165 [Candidatus Melainabacteria bacterium]|nr:MAG: hypothetical protein C5B53_01165 [Candidatus Melainabacteria bacterium]
MTLSPGDFGASFKGFLEQMTAEASSEEPVFFKHLQTHFDCDPTTLPIIGEGFEDFEHANVHLALEEYLKQENRETKIIGVMAHDMLTSNLSSLMAPSRASLMGSIGAKEGPVQYVNVEAGHETILTCVKSGLYLISQSEKRLAVFLKAPGEKILGQKGKIEVIAPDKDEAQRFLAEIRSIKNKNSIYRGKVISVGSASTLRSPEIKFHHLTKVERKNIILPDGLLERIERQTIGFSKHSQKLLAAGRHLKHGLLLYGPPGTGKTLTAMYLASEMTDRTIILLTGRGLGAIEQSCNLAQTLQPATIILEDVDLVAEDRKRIGGTGPLLFELLNEMDGLRDDADILFLLTTNRPDILEPALAARPGRIDQAFEMPLPDDGCRRRLFILYSNGLTMEIKDSNRFIQKTEGASPAFIRELFRRAALCAANDGEELIVKDQHLEEALYELTVQGGDLTKSLLGFRTFGFQSGNRAPANAES